MGLFDYVRCEVPLPDGFEGELQTKDFYLPCMLRHVITKDGRFMEMVLIRTELVPENERPYPDSPFIGCMRSITEMKDANFHGILNFYGHEGNRADGTWKWHEYNAKFTDGRLVEIIIASPERQDEKHSADEFPLGKTEA